jgi:hypothetical protein
LGFLAGAGNARRFSLKLPCSIARYPYGLFYGLIWPKGGCASIVWPQRRRTTFFPWAAPIPRETRNSPGWRPPLRYGLHADAAPIASGLLIAIEAAMVAGSRTANKENTHG